MSFTYAVPRLSLSGEGAVSDAIALLAQQGIRSALVLTDRVIRGLDGGKLLFAALEKQGIAYQVFDAIEPNPTTKTVEAAFAEFQKLSPGVVIALGGGSVIDTAKSVRILSANPGPIANYEGVHNNLKNGVMLVAISTTSGTAAEVTSNAVITDTVRHIKMVIISHSTIPDIAVNDPAVLLSIPAAITASTGMDALTHAIEAYVSTGAHTLTDPSALESIRIITEWLPKAYDNGSDAKAREMMAHGQYLAGMAFNSAGLGCVHSLAHQPGATHNLAHGVCNAILLPVVEEFNRVAAVPRFARIAQAMGVDTQGMSDEAASLAAIAAIRTLSKRVRIPANFGTLGIVEADIEAWIEPALNDPCTPGNPRVLSADDVRQLYRSAI
ncbi:MAG: iron-containing alcohol dehydrogenase [Terracidiphilus sp.]|nr:iron-containing alcohol dehydrogenase [Terracidiphilus sp.]MDR3777318.1 iron-containing alcohol dehydrogenase [Terracidiphilus sp.]